MTPQERQLLESLASRIAGTAVPQKDPEAEALIREKLGTKPDALYILTQTVLIQEMALNQANTRIHDLQQQSAQPPQQPTSFLGRLFGSGAPQQSAPPPPQYAPPPQYPPQYEPVQYQQAPSQGSSFLRSAATTATGVAAGALAFEGIESLFGHHGGYGGGYGGGFGGGGEFLGGAPGETVINNYYEEPRGGGGEREQFSNADYNDPGLQDGNDSDISAADYDTSQDSSGDDSSSSDV